MITAIFALATSLQPAGEVAEAVRNDNPQTWTLEYPRVISPYVDEYYECLKSGEVVMHAQTTFEAQHRLALTECSAERQELVEGAIAVLAKRAKSDERGADEVTATFNTIEMIHIARGRDLDQQMAIMVQGRPLERKVEVAPAVSEVPASNSEATTQ